MELLRAVGYLDIIYKHLSTRFFPRNQKAAILVAIRKYVHDFWFENGQKVCRIDLDLGGVVEQAV